MGVVRKRARWVAVVLWFDETVDDEDPRKPGHISFAGAVREKTNTTPEQLESLVEAMAQSEYTYIEFPQDILIALEKGRVERQ